MSQFVHGTLQRSSLIYVYVLRERFVPAGSLRRAAGSMSWHIHQTTPSANTTAKSPVLVLMSNSIIYLVQV